MVTLQNDPQQNPRQNPRQHFQGGVQYESVLGIEKTPHNVLFFKASAIFFSLQFVLFYGTWFLFPKLAKDRRSLGWLLSMFCSISFLSLSLLEVGYMRTTLFERLGLDAISLGVAPAETATLFSTFTPGFLAWVEQMSRLTSIDTGTGPGIGRLAEAEFNLIFNNFNFKSKMILIPRVAGTVLQWFVSLPIFSLAPLKPTQVYSPEAVSKYLGGGGRLLLSLETFPNESVFGALAVGYFVGFCMADLVLGFIHYVEYVDPLSGWIHHILYSALAYRMAMARELSLFAVCGGPLEFSTIFLASGYVIPRLRSDFWFPVSFILVRILYNLFLWHETYFNYGSPSGAPTIYGLAFVVHVFWLQKYFRGRMRRTARKRQAAAAAAIGAVKDKKEALDWEGRVLSGSRATSSAIESTLGRTVQLRAKDLKS